MVAKVKTVLTAEDRSKTAFRSFNGSLSKAQGGISSFRAAAALMVPAAVIAGLDRMAKAGENAAKSIDLIGKNAKKVGLTAEAYQKMIIVGEAAGVSVNKVTANYAKFVKRLGQAQVGTGQLAGTLEMLKISLTDSTGQFRTAVDVQDEFHRKLRDTADFTVQVAHAAQAYGVTGGNEMIEVIRTTTAEQDALIEKMEEYGAILSNEVVAGAEDVATQLGLVNRAQEIIKNNAALQLAPMALKWAEMKSDIAVSVMNLAEFFHIIDTQTSQDKFNTLLKEQLELEGRISRGRRGRNRNDTLGDAKARLAAVKNELQAMRDIREARDRKPMEIEISKAAAAEERAVEAQLKVRKEAADKFLKEKERLDTLMAKQAAKARLKDIQMEAAYQDERLRVLNDIAKDEMDLEMKKQQATQKWLDTSLDGLITFATEGKDAFKGFAKAVILDLIKIQLQQQFTGLFGGLFGGLLGGAASPINTTAGVSLAGSAGQVNVLMNANGNAFNGGSVVPFANGGVFDSPTAFPMRGGKTGVLGEAGPEAILPLTRGPNGALGVIAEGAGGKSVTIQTTVNVQGKGDGEQISKEVVMAIRGLVKQELGNSSRPGNQLNPGSNWS